MTRSISPVQSAINAVALHYGLHPDHIAHLLAGVTSEPLPGYPSDPNGYHLPLRLTICGISAATAVRRGLAPYAHDEVTTALSESISEIFGRGVWLPCPTATAAGIIALRHLETGLYPGAVFMEDIGHGLTLEAGACAAGTAGALTPVAVATDQRGVMNPSALRDALFIHCPAHAERNLGAEHFRAPRAVVMSWPSTLGVTPTIADLQVLREICDSYRMALIIDFAWGMHALATTNDPHQCLREIICFADAITFSLSKMGCGMGALLFLPRCAAETINQLRALAKPIGALIPESWDIAARWHAIWSRHHNLLWATLREENTRAATIRTGLRARRLEVQTDATTNIVMFSVPREMADLLARHGVTRWPLHTRWDWRTMRLAVGPWYPPSWEKTFFELIASETT